MDQLIERIKTIQAQVAVEQIPKELAELIRLAKVQDVRSVLEIGSRFGGTLKCWLELLSVNAVLAVDFPLEGSKVQAERCKLWESWRRPGQSTQAVFGKSEAPETLASVRVALSKLGLPQVDMLFIDGGHSYEQVQADYTNYRQFAKKLIAFHDITASTIIDPKEFGTDRFWQMIKRGKKHREFCFPKNARGGYGIGVLEL